MTRHCGSSAPATLGEGAIGCVYRSDQALDAAAASVLELGLTAGALHLGATDAHRASEAAQRIGIAADIHADDPLSHLAGLADRADTRGAIDRTGIAGAAIGAIAGVALSFTPAGAAVVANASPMVANTAFSFVLGAIVGSVLGAALGPQPTTHVGFRLIDGMQEGAYVLIVTAVRERLDELQQVMEAAGGTGTTRV
ncbi:MAG TPA: hypothetical protein VGQ96_03080 [Candidatus Eremiobacteraceae bacterium]|nr:hypothetical protein [Candidatus Eremiobacteraceae bacterium]